MSRRLCGIGDTGTGIYRVGVGWWMQRGASAMAAAADAPSIALFIRSIRVMDTRRYPESSGQKGRVDAMNGNRIALVRV